MAEASHLSRYHPAVLAVTGIAAAYGIYAVYSTYTDHTNPPVKRGALHRRNAIHRSQGNRSQSHAHFNVDLQSPDGPAELGSLIVTRDDLTLVIRLGLDPLPIAEDLVEVFGTETVSPYGDVVATIGVAAIEGTLYHCFLAFMTRSVSNNPPMGLTEVVQAFETDEPNDLRRCKYRLADMFPTVNYNLVASTVERFFTERRQQIIDNAADEGGTFSEGVPETENMGEQMDGHHEPTQGLKRLLYHIAEEDAQRKAYEHRGINCEVCGQSPIRGIRWHCLNCPNFDLCSTCEMDTVHVRTHVFAKIKIPLPVLSQPSEPLSIWYPGDARRQHPPIPSMMRKVMAEKYKMEETKIDALYDQFTCIANVPFPNDPHSIRAGIDIRAFRKALTSERWSERRTPDLFYLRMFVFYDTNGDGLIDFAEFVSGIDYIRGKHRYEHLRRALQGYDVHGDEWISRQDVLRLLRAKFEIHRRLVNDMVDSQEKESRYKAMEVLRNTNPISSTFTQDTIPRGENRASNGKRLDENLDMQPLPDTKTILDESDPWPAHTSNFVSNIPRERLREELARIGDQLYGGPEENEEVDAATAQSRISEEADEEAHGTKAQETNEEPSDTNSEQDIPPFAQDAVGEVVEKSINELLDRIFKEAEDTHRAVIESKSERERLRPQIEEYKQWRVKFILEKMVIPQDAHPNQRVEMSIFPKRFPELAAQLFAEDGEEVEEEPATSMQSEVQNGIIEGDLVPTDEESLRMREKEIAEKSLEDLLKEAGYSTTDAADEGPSTSAGEEKPTIVSSDAQDAQASRDIGATESTGPTRRRLQRLIDLEKIESDMSPRRIPRRFGAMSFSEIEAIAHSDPTEEIKALLISWLEWASF